VNSYFPNQSPASASYPRSYTTTTLSPTHRTLSVQNLATKPQQAKRRYADFQEVGQGDSYSVHSKRHSGITTHSTGDERRLRLKSPCDTPSLWAVPEVRPVGRPRGRVSAKPDSHPVPFQSVPEARAHTSLLCQRSPSIVIDGDDTDDELAVEESIALQSEETKQDSIYSVDSEEEMDLPNHDVKGTTNDDELTFDDAASTIRHRSKDAFPSALDDPDDLEASDDEVNLFGISKTLPALSDEHQATTQAVENISQAHQSRNVLPGPMATPKRSTTSFPLPNGRCIQSRVDSSRKSIESRTSGQDFIVRPPQQLLGGTEELAITPTNVLEGSIRKQTLSSGGSTGRRKKPRALFIQGLSAPRTSLLKVHPTVAESVAAAAGRLNPYQTASKTATDNQATLSASAMKLPTTESPLPDPRLHYASDDQMSQTRRQGRPRKSDSRLEHLLYDDAPRSRGRGRPRKSDPAPSVAFEESPIGLLTATDPSIIRSRNSESRRPFETKDSTTSHPRTHGRPYNSPWDLEDDIRLIDLITVQKFSFQKVYDSNLFPGKTIPAIVHRYYRVLGGPVKQVKKWSNPPRECENCHIEYRPGKRVKSSADTLCIACSLYAKAHGGRQRPFGSDRLSITPDGLSILGEVDLSSINTAPV
jgi:hypothetical protein